MSEYQTKFQDGEKVECDCCHYPGRVAEFPNTLTDRGRCDLVLCEVCSQTHLSLARKYPLQCSDAQLYRSIGFIANMLLEAIREGKS